jgi:hypothetical protein
LEKHWKHYGRIKKSSNQKLEYQRLKQNKHTKTNKCANKSLQPTREHGRFVYGNSRLSFPESLVPIVRRAADFGCYA